MQLNKIFFIYINCPLLHESLVERLVVFKNWSHICQFLAQMNSENHLQFFEMSTLPETFCNSLLFQGAPRDLEGNPSCLKVLGKLFWTWAAFNFFVSKVGCPRLLEGHFGFMDFETFETFFSLLINCILIDVLIAKEIFGTLNSEKWIKGGVMRSYTIMLLGTNLYKIVNKYWS